MPRSQLDLNVNFSNTTQIDIVMSNQVIWVKAEFEKLWGIKANNKGYMKIKLRKKDKLLPLNYKLQNKL